MSYPVPTKKDPVQFEIMVDRIMSVFKRSTREQEAAGRSWYRVAHDLAKMISDDPVVGAGVIAALSANKSWDDNQTLASRYFAGDRGGTFEDALRKADRIMNGEHPLIVLPLGSKTYNFYRCIVDPSDRDAVTVDRHAHDIVAGAKYGQRDRGLRNPSRYTLIADAYREAARRLGELPSTVQAVTWTVWISKEK